MNQISVSIPSSLQEFVEAQVSAGAYTSVSEYLEKLIRDACEARERIERSLLEALNSGPATPFSRSDFDALRARSGQITPDR
jgi:putative addiction module CopG family antidote